MPYRAERLDTVFLLSVRGKKMPFRTRSFTSCIHFTCQMVSAYTIVRSERGNMEIMKQAKKNNVKQGEQDD